MARRRRPLTGSRKVRFDKKRASLSKKVDKILSRQKIPNVMSKSGFPTNKVVKMRYVSSISLADAAGGVLVKNHFRANGIYDPDYTGTGHQPLGRDQWATFYNEYVVLGSKITVRFLFAAGTVPIVCGVFLTNSHSTGTSFRQLNEQGRSRGNIINASSATKNTVVKGYYSARKFHNVVDVRDNFDNLGALLGSSPSALADYVVYAQSYDEAGTMTARALVEIDYIVAFSSPNELSLS